MNENIKLNIVNKRAKILQYTRFVLKRKTSQQCNHETVRNKPKTTISTTQTKL